jgi:hypothetical protein
MIAIERILDALAVCSLRISSFLAQLPTADKLNAKSLEAAVSFAQSLAQWEFVIIGSSVLLVVGSSHRRPESIRLRAIYALLLPAAWLSLAVSIYYGTRVQQVYLAYMLLPSTTIEGATRVLNGDLHREMFWMYAGLTALICWLMVYLAWWLFHKDTPKEWSYL